jgi:hypothetical protein
MTDSIYPADAYRQACDTANKAKDLLAKAEAAIARVREIHQPVDALNVAIGKVQQVCTGCGKDDGNWETWPCPTIRALEEGGRR